MVIKKEKLIKGIGAVEKYIPLTPATYASQIVAIYGKVGEYDTDEYNVQINPFFIYEVDPKNISYNTGREWKPWNNPHQLIGQVKPGDWDLRAPVNVPEKSKPYGKKFSEMPRYISFKEHFINDVPWDDTVLYDKLVEQIYSSNYPSFSAPSDVDRFLQHKDHLFEQIRRNGYKSQLELATKHDSYLGALLNEVLIDIGRDGQALFVDGRHRLSIAKLLDIDKIPVVVLVRHRQWMETLENCDELPDVA